MILFGNCWMGGIEIGVPDGNKLNSFNDLVHTLLYDDYA